MIEQNLRSLIFINSNEIPEVFISKMIRRHTRKITFIGDPQRRVFFGVSKLANKLHYFKDVSQRFSSSGFPKIVFKKQHNTPLELAHFFNEVFYHKKLDLSQCQSGSPSVQLINVSSQESPKNHSFENSKEADAVVLFIQKNSKSLNSFCVVSHFHQQRTLLEEKLKEKSLEVSVFGPNTLTH